MGTVDVSRIKQLPLQERLDVVEDIWDSIARDAAPVEVPPWHREILRKRLADYRSNPEPGAPWPDVRRRIERGYESKP